MSWLRGISASVLILLCVFSVQGENRRGISSALRPIVRGAILPLYAPGSPDAGVVVHFQSLTNQAQRHGFFRVALLREMVVQEVRVEIRQMGQVPQIMERLPKLLRDKNIRRKIEFQNLTITDAARPGWLLTARRARISSESGLLLTDMVLHRPDEVPVTSREAKLVLSGDNSGLLKTSTMDQRIFPSLTQPKPPPPL